jgi:hypothetical protein
MWMMCPLAGIHLNVRVLRWNLGPVGRVEPVGEVILSHDEAGFMAFLVFIASVVTRQHNLYYMHIRKKLRADETNEKTVAKTDLTL